MNMKLKRLISLGLVAVVAIAIGVSTKYVTGADVTLLEKGVKAKVDSAAYADENYQKTIVPYILDNAYPLAELDAAVIADPKVAGAKYGNRDGDNAAYSVATTFTATGGELKGDLLVLEVEGVKTPVYLQVGPALNGTALRDVTGIVKFTDFENQLAYQDIGTKLNDKVRDTVLSLSIRQLLLERRWKSSELSHFSIQSSTWWFQFQLRFWTNVIRSRCSKSQGHHQRVRCDQGA
jgi:predicted lipoprotein